MSEKPEEDTSRFPLLARMFLWTDDRRAVDRFVYGLFAVCAGLFLADFFYDKHVYLTAEKIPGFYALYGFVMCGALVFCAKGLRRFVKRDEDYYAPHGVESESYPEDQLGKADHDA